tara:strand:+ start:146 stop:607 length:462 start_codon:yes stop_codon:yes gene_type:complete
MLAWLTSGYIAFGSLISNQSYLIYGFLIIIAFVVYYMSRYTTSRRIVSRKIGVGQDYFKNIYDNYILLFFALLGLFLIIKEFINDIKSGFISLGCFILTMTMSLILGPKAGSDYFVKKILNELIKLEESEKKVNQQNAKLLRKSINKIKKIYQ